MYRRIYRNLNILNLLRSQNRLVFSYERLLEVVKNSDDAIISYVNPYVLSVITLEDILLIKNWYVVFDGNSICYLYSKIYRNKIESLNIDFSGVAEKLLKHFNSNNIKSVFLGGKANESSLFERKLYKRLDYDVKVLNGYDPKNRKDFLSDFNGDYIHFVSLGSPMQENYILSNVKNINSIFFTSGGFVSQEATSKNNYYPNFIVKLKLRFLYRAFCDFNVFKRILTIYPLFYFVLAIHQFKSLKK